MYMTARESGRRTTKFTPLSVGMSEQAIPPPAPNIRAVMTGSEMWTSLYTYAVFRIGRALCPF